MPLVIRARTLGYSSVESPQHVHTRPTSRLGGSALFLAYALGVAVEVLLGGVPPKAILALLACALPVVLAGFWEDITRALPPKHRLLAAVASALVASIYAGGLIARLDVPYVDSWLTEHLFALLLTCFMVAGACNALNLIDGANGLAGGTALLMFTGLAAMAFHVDDSLVFVQAVTMIGALAGFLYWNYPRARVFLGDGGAYFLGFIYAELSIQLIARNAHVSAWFVIMLAAYPIMETLYSIYRRKIVLRTPSTEPDALHLHSLIYSQVTLPAEPDRSAASQERANACVAPRLWLHGMICLALALGLHDNTGALLVGIVAYVMFYITHYRRLLRIAGLDPDGVAQELQDTCRTNTNVVD